MTEAIQMINAVINTLNDVEIKGLKNCDRLLGSAQTLQRVVDMLSKEEPEDG